MSTHWHTHHSTKWHLSKYHSLRDECIYWGSLQSRSHTYHLWCAHVRVWERKSDGENERRENEKEWESQRAREREQQSEREKEGLREEKWGERYEKANGKIEKREEKRERSLWIMTCLLHCHVLEGGTVGLCCSALCTPCFHSLPLQLQHHSRLYTEEQQKQK